MNYEVLNHACVRIEGSRILYFDPFGLKDAPHDADYIFITHDHYDHLSPEDIKKVARKGSTIIKPLTVSYDEFNAVSMVVGDTLSLSDIKIEAVAAYNPTKQFHPKSNGWLGYVVTIDGMTFYIAGDTDDTAEAREVRCDVAFLPVGGKFTCNADEAAALAKAINPAVQAVPYHFGAIVGTSADAERFMELIKK